MNRKILDFILRTRGKMAAITSALFSAMCGFVGYSAVVTPNEGTVSLFALSLVLAIFYTVNAYYQIRAELMDELMARLSSKEMDNDSNSFNA